MDEKTNISEKSIITIAWNTKNVDYSHEKEENLRREVAAKYGVPLKNVKIEPSITAATLNGVDVTVNQETIENIHDPRFQQNLFWIYLKDAGIEDYDKDLILTIDSQINSQINYDAYDRAKRYDIRYIKWDNFLSYGSGNSFDFSKLKGLVLLNGEPANQSGKSTFALDLVHYALFGKVASAKVKVLSDYFNYNPVCEKETEVKVEIGLTIDGVDYIIRRKLTRPDITKKNRTKITQSVEWFRVENGEEIELEDSDNMNGLTSIQTNKAIKDAIGSEKDFDLVICANSKTLTDLIDLGNTERGRLLNRWTGLDLLEAKDEIARTVFNTKIKPTFKSNIYNREELQQDINAFKEVNKESAETIAKKQELIEFTDKELLDLDKRRDDLLQSLKNVDETLISTDVTTVETEIATITEEGKKKRNELNDKKVRIDEIGEISFDEAYYKQCCDNKIAYTTQIVSLKSNIKQLKQAVKDLQTGEYCPTCGRKLDNVDNSALIEANNQRINALIQDGIKAKALLDDTDKEIARLEETRKLKIEKDKLELKISALNVEISGLLTNYKIKKKLIEDCLANKEAIEYNNRTNADIAVLKESIRTKTNVKIETGNEIASLKKDIEHNESCIRDREALIEELNSEEKIRRHWSIYTQMVGKNGISKMILREALPIINSSVARFLDGVCDFDIEVVINDENDVAFNIIKKNGAKRHLGSGSGFEQTVAALALRIALGNMSSMSKPPFILLDEVFGSVAKQNYENLSRLLDRIKGFYKYVFMITHEADVKTWADSTITVVKDENGISSIVE